LALSVVLVTQNAAAQLPECLASVAFADEVLVVDSDSSDGTVEVAERYGARVLNKEWLGFGRQKQYAVEQAAHDWVLCLDADERVSPELAASLVRALGAPAAPVYRMARRNRFLGRWLRHGEGYPDWSARLFDRRRARWSDDAVHEKVIGEPVATLAGDLLHESAEDLGRYLEKQNRYTSLAAAELHRQGRSAGIADLAISPLARFVKFYLLRLGFLDGLPGLVHISIGCINSFMKYAKLMEMRREDGR
jgi:glycosyltransferase involved in cell wall biosynthesis